MLDFLRSHQAEPVFTFHYGSILIQDKQPPPIKKEIYIPLWFYSNRAMQAI